MLGTGTYTKGTIIMNRTLGLALSFVPLLGFAACSSSERIGAATTSTSDVATTSTVDPAATTTTEAVTTTVAATAVETTAVPPTSDDTPPPMPALRGGGIGATDFGATDDEVLSLLSPAYGGVATDASQTFTLNESPDLWTDEFGEAAFVTPIARIVCFANTVCTYFGGTDAANLTFLGWEINGEASPEPATIEGIVIGDRWSDHAASMTRDPGGCYSYGYGTTIDGITVGMISSGDMFNFYDDAADTWSDGFPDPATVTIVYLSAGERVFSLYEDC